MGLLADQNSIMVHAKTNTVKTFAVEDPNNFLNRKMYGYCKSRQFGLTETEDSSRLKLVVLDTCLENELVNSVITTVLLQIDQGKPNVTAH